MNFFQIQVLRPKMTSYAPFSRSKKNTDSQSKRNIKQHEPSTSRKDKPVRRRPCLKKPTHSIPKEDTSLERIKPKDIMSKFGSGDNTLIDFNDTEPIEFPKTSDLTENPCGEVLDKFVDNIEDFYEFNETYSENMDDLDKQLSKICQSDEWLYDENGEMIYETVIDTDSLNFIDATFSKYSHITDTIFRYGYHLVFKIPGYICTIDKSGQVSQKAITKLKIQELGREVEFAIIFKNTYSLMYQDGEFIQKGRDSKGVLVKKTFKAMHSDMRFHDQELDQESGLPWDFIWRNTLFAKGTLKDGTPYQIDCEGRVVIINRDEKTGVTKPIFTGVLYKFTSKSFLWDNPVHKTFKSKK